MFSCARASMGPLPMWGKLAIQGSKRFSSGKGQFNLENGMALANSIGNKVNRNYLGIDSAEVCRVMQSVHGEESVRLFSTNSSVHNTHVYLDWGEMKTQVSKQAFVNLLNQGLLKDYGFVDIQHPPEKVLRFVPFPPPDMQDENPVTFDQHNKVLRQSFDVRKSKSLHELEGGAFDRFKGGLNSLSGTVNDGNLFLALAPVQTSSGPTYHRYLTRLRKFQWEVVSSDLRNMCLEQRRAARVLGTVYFSSICGVREFVSKTHGYTRPYGMLLSQRFIRGVDLEQAEFLEEDWFSRYQTNSEEHLVNLAKLYTVIHGFLGILDQWNPKNLIIVDQSEVATGPHISIDHEFASPDKVIFEFYKSFTGSVPMTETSGIPFSYQWRQEFSARGDVRNYVQDLVFSGDPLLKLMYKICDGDLNRLINIPLPRNFLERVVQNESDLDHVVTFFKMHSDTEVASGELTYQRYIELIKEMLKEIDGKKLKASKNMTLLNVMAANSELDSSEIVFKQSGSK